MGYLLYDIILLISSLLLVPYYLLKGLKCGKRGRLVMERFGFYRSGRLGSLRGKKLLWVHAASVGETRSVVPLIRALRRDYPEAVLALSNCTETGHLIAEGIPEVDLALFIPFDLSWVVRKVLLRIRPNLIIIVETEIWPNFIRIAHEMKIPIVLANGRISDRSFPRYLRVRFWFAPILKKFTSFCMQGEQDAERICCMGALAEKVVVTGNIKFDLQVTLPDPKEVMSLRRSFRLPPTFQVLVAGSTHPGEEKAVVNAYRQLCESGRDLILILVPRHPERCRSIAHMLGELGFTVQLRSGVMDRWDTLQPGEILLGDTLGEMLKFYAVADLVFLGGSLVPVGGHNALEASALQKPVVFGPYMHNFKDITAQLIAAGGGIQINSQEELPGTLDALLDDPVRRLKTGEAGHTLLRQNAGATNRILKVVRQLTGN